MDETSCTRLWGKYVNVDVCGGFLAEASDMPYHVKGEILPSDSGAQCFIQKLPMGVV